MTDSQQPATAGHVYAYNLDTATTPAGLKIRWRVKIATGTEAERLDVIQQEAILALLTWADKHMKTDGKTHAQHAKILSGNSREPIENGRE